MQSLHIPDSDTIYRLMAIDPGTNTLGFCIIEIDLVTLEKTVIFVHTLVANKTMDNYGTILESYGEKLARLRSHFEALYYHMCEWNVHGVVSESPYMGRFPQAFMSLVECMDTIRQAVMQYDISITLETIDPASVKTAVGVSGKDGDKTKMLEAMKNRPDLKLASGIDLNALDEHSIDALAVGYARATYLFPNASESN